MAEKEENESEDVKETYLESRNKGMEWLAENGHWREKHACSVSNLLDILRAGTRQRM